MSTGSEQSSVHERQGSVWEYVSPSRLALFCKCPLAFRLRYIDGVKCPTSPALFVGKSVHAGLEHYYRHKMLGWALGADDLRQRMLNYWEEMATDERVQFESTAQETALRSQAVDLVTTYLAQVPLDEARPIAVETMMEVPLTDPVTGEDLGLPLLGITDLVLDEASGPLICDFKTSSKAAPPFEITHELQLSSYAWLFRHVSGRDEAGLEVRSLIKTRRPKVETHRYPPRTDRHFRRLFSVLHEYLDALDSGRFNYRPGWGCSMCDFRENGCRAWSGY